MQNLGKMKNMKIVHSKKNQHYLLFAILFCGVSSALFYLFDFNNISLIFLILAGLCLVKKNLSDAEIEAKKSETTLPFHC